MTRDEVKKLLFVMSSAFPNFHPANMTATADVWAIMLADDPYDDISVALKTYMRTDTTGFAPSISQLLNISVQNHQADDMSEGEAWAMVRKAISDSAYHADERFAEFPEEVQRAVGSPSQLRIWATTEDFNDGVVQSNFLRSYRQTRERKRQVNAIGNKLMAEIEARRTEALRLSAGNNNLLEEAKK